MKEEFRLYKIAERKSKNKFYRYFNGDKLYVSNYGRCRINDEIVQPIIMNKYGYCTFGGVHLHIIVYELFRGEIPEGFEIDHIDANPRNNCVENLRVCTHKENMNNSLSIKHRSDVQQKKPVLQFSKEGILIKEYESSYSAARETKIHHGDICQCCKGKRYKSAGGYIWKYKN